METAGRERKPLCEEMVRNKVNKNIAFTQLNKRMDC